MDKDKSMVKPNKLIQPFLKWVGGKRQLLPKIIANLPKEIKKLKYFEPFIGGGALFFNLQPKDAVINDFNAELINVYRVIKNNIEALIIDLKKHQNTSEYFYKIRQLDRTIEFKQLSDIQRASRIIYLNKTCYNGLYRVNNAGKFNTPFGRYKNPNIINEPILKAVNLFLNEMQINICCEDYADILKEANDKSFVYLDPPYYPLSQGSNFTGYIEGGWNKAEQIRLRDVCNELNKKGVKFLLSNSASDFIKELYVDYNIITVKASRFVNSKALGRGEIDELLIKNYE